MPEPEVTAQPEEAPVSRLGKARLGVFSGMVCAGACAWSLNMVSFLHAKEFVFCLGMAILAVLSLFRPLSEPRRAGHAPLGVLACAVLLALLALATDRAGPATLVWLSRALVIVLPVWLVSDLLQRRAAFAWACGALVMSGVLVSSLAVLQYLGAAPLLFPVFPGYEQPAYSVFGNQDLLGGYAALSLALAVSMLLRGVYGVFPQSRPMAWFCALSLIPLAGGLLVSMSRSAWLAAAVGGFFAVPWRALFQERMRGAFSRRHALLFLPVVVTVLAAALLAPAVSRRVGDSFNGGDVGYRVRLWLWAGAAEMTATHPVTGVGWGNYGFNSPKYLGRVLWRPGGEQYFRNELHADNAHSEPLEFFAENGIAGGGVLAAVLLVSFVLKRWFWRGSGWLPPSVSRGPLVALAVFSLFNAALHSAPHALAGLMLAAGGGWCCAAHARCGPPVRPSIRRAVRAALAAGVAAVAVFHVYGVVVPSVLLRRAESAHLAGGPDAEEGYLAALRLGIDRSQAHEDHAILLIDRGRYGEALAELEMAGEGIDTGRLHLLRALCHEALGNGPAAFDSAVECVFRWPGNRRAWELLLRHAPPALAPAWRERSGRWISP